MTSATSGQNHQSSTMAEKLLDIGMPRFPIFEQWRLAGLSPPEVDLPPGGLPIPEVPPNVSAVKINNESAAAAWLTTHIRKPGDVVLALIPAWAGEGATTCVLPKLVGYNWPETDYPRIDKSETSCLRVTDVRGKGKGCVAARAVPRGELVARERALYIVPRTFLDTQQIARTAMAMMTPNQRTAILALYNCKSTDPDDVKGIIGTNGILIPGMPNHDVVYVASSKLSRASTTGIDFPFVPTIPNNSTPFTSCCPNATFRWDNASFSGEIRALRPIPEGEEVTIAYFQEIMAATARRPERQKYLDEYNFKCACAICGRSSKERSRSDEDRPTIWMSVHDIGKFYREIVHDWITRGGNDHTRLLNYLHAVEEALDREMIFSPICWIYLARVIVMARCALREARPARKWAQRAAQHTRALTGSDGGWDAIAGEPEKCGWWGMWNKPRLRGIWV
ncbi:hypothetical protein B0F90DRAFT_1814196 [Multifurca ochricompacta]|uniref:SET domain-containing protein n=1 Tax=Multifurca ochricompacta TaxID=376703 RepID=A0AAD4MAY0_9AGAM|nr:hypothetical protein B0F90DRAFT_1814196 [Multifurca ochricompacta]